MKKVSFPLFLLLITLFTSCSPKIATIVDIGYQPLASDARVLILEESDKMPSNTESLGIVKIYDSGMSTNCGYETVIEKAKIEARKIGGNVIKIQEHIKPNFLGSSCHQITAHILKIESFNQLVYDVTKEDLLDIDYAILNVYRSSGVGALVNYKLRLGDSILCKVKNNFKTTLHIKREGMNTLWAKTESKVEIPVNFEHGRIYYLRCGLKMGAFVGRPKLELVDNITGKLEFKTIKQKK